MKLRVNAPSGLGERRRSLRALAPIVIVCLSVILMAVRFFRFTDTYAVNVLWWDQWDFLDPFFEGAGILERAWRQYGPHRQGVGALVTSIVYAASSWNTRVEAFTVAAILVLTALGALWLKVRLFSRLEMLDALIPVLVLTLHQGQMVADTVNPAHGALPMLLVVSFALAQTIAGVRLRIATSLILSSLCTFTGFGFFLGLVAPAVFVSELKNATSGRHRTFAAVATAASLLVFGSYFWNYQFNPYVACFRFPDSQPAHYASFVGALLLQRATFAAFEGLSFHLVTYAAAAAFCAVAALAWVDQLRRPNPPSLVVAILVSVCLAFAANAAIGRLCLGLAASRASRYVPFASLGWLGVYFALVAARKHRRLIRDSKIAVVVFFVLTERVDRSEADRYANWKRTWVGCYREKHDVAACDAVVGFPVHFAPSAARVPEKLDFLESRRLNLFAGQEPK